MKWVCKKCGSDDLQEVGSLVETFVLGEIVTDEHGLPMPHDGYAEDGNVCWDCYELKGFECIACGTMTDTLAELVEPRG